MKSSLTSERGITIVEAAIVLPILIILFIGIIDFGRILAIRGVLTAGAYQGLNLAATLPGLEVDDRDCDTWSPPPSSCVQTPTQDDNKISLAEARAQVVARALEFPLATLLTIEPNESMATIRLAQNGDGALFFRPGDPQKFDYLNNARAHFDPDCDDTIPPGGTAVPFDGYENLRLSCPMVIEIDAEVRTFLPGLGVLSVTGRAAGFGESTISGTFPLFTPPPPTTTSTTATTTTQTSTSTTVTVTTTTSTTSTTSTTVTSTSTTVTATSTTVTSTSTTVTVTSTTVTVTSTTTTVTSTSTTSTNCIDPDCGTSTGDCSLCPETPQWNPATCRCREPIGG